ncbi:MAG: threonine/serine ThrE exporter family protein [Clostridia bacterium]|jgi:uncharacterized membrane protein YjjP (DUF1212 family)|nr:threonine/serine exporter family protein [Clostridiaceae bacterium]
MKAIDILELAMYAGRIMLESGAEVYRVEDTVARICKSFGASRIECTITVTGMDASICYQGETVTLIQRVRKKEINLTKIERINQLSRDLAQGEPDIQKAKELLDEINAIRSYKAVWLVLFSGISSAFFCFMFKGRIESSILAFFTGALTRLVLILLAKAGFTGFINDLAGGMLISFFSISLSSFFNTGNINEIIIGSIMILVPGVAITNAILDIFHQDYISGTVKAVDALLTIVAVSAGVAIVFSLSNMFEGGFL